ncbi:MAG: hypothetical protein ACXQTU_02190 [Candidatus Nezhaarchaeales archaeon]
MAKSVKVLIEKLGPIEKAEIEIKPLTIIVGKSSYTLSLLLATLYLLASTFPDFSKLEDFAVTEILRLCERAHASAVKGNMEMLEEYMRKLFDLHLDSIGRLIAGSLSKRFKEFFNVDSANKLLKGSIRVSSSESPFYVDIEPKGSELNVSFRVVDKPLVKINSISRMGESMGINASFLIGEQVVLQRDLYVKTPLDLATEYAQLTKMIVDKLSPISFGSIEAHLIAEARATILRLTPLIYSLAIGYQGVQLPALEATSMQSYVELARKFKLEVTEELHEALADLLSEVGIKDFSMRLMASYPMILVDSIMGDRISLEDSPSEVRACLPIILGSTSKLNGPRAIFIDKLEEGLHPKAVSKLMKLIATSIMRKAWLSERQTIVLTTKSPATLTALSTAIKEKPTLRDYMEILYLKREKEVEKGEKLAMTPQDLNRIVDDLS